MDSSRRPDIVQPKRVTKCFSLADIMWHDFVDSDVEIWVIYGNQVAVVVVVIVIAVPFFSKRS